MTGRTSYQHGRCSHCNGLYVLTTKGLMRRHYRRGMLCGGSGRGPKPPQQAAPPPGRSWGT